MRELKVSNRYAQSIIELAIERDELEAVKNDMELIQLVLSENRDLALLLKSSIVKPDKKQTILKSIFEGKVSELTTKFIEIVISKGRESILSIIAQCFIEQYKIGKNISSAKVITAVPLSEALRSKILKLVEVSEQQKVEIEEVVDPSIIGGLIVRVGDKQVDNSIRRKINDLKQSFSKNPYIAEL